ncbi:unnamed protein product [Phytomonas sp. EM1]|nr:unnamed protein product [Phytomonas sp. EM1]|eukprot:CCW64898.1 unnamed protein product [Phytomonas sp. isolate EM1]
MKRETRAEAYFLLAIEAYNANAKVEPVQRSYASDVLDDLGLFYVDFHHFEKAERCFRQALAIRVELLGEHHATVAYSYSNLALLHLLRGELEPCEAQCHAALELYAKTARQNVLAQADVHTVLGQCLHQKKNYPEALKWLEKALNHRRVQGETSEIAVAESLNHIARVYISMERYGKAHTHVKEARRIAFRLNQHLTQSLRAEVEKTERMLPAMTEWPAAELAEAGMTIATAPESANEEKPTKEKGSATPTTGSTKAPEG